MLTEKEFEVIKQIHKNKLPNQRIIAQNVGISLGLTNLIIKRLIKKGYVKVKQLNRKKLKYILTPKGFSEKTKKSYKFAIKTINIIRTIKQKIHELILTYYDKGIREFVICGDNKELSEIVELVLKSLNRPGIVYRYINTIDDFAANNNRTMLVITNFAKTHISMKHALHLVDYLSEVGISYQ